MINHKCQQCILIVCKLHEQVWLNTCNCVQLYHAMVVSITVALPVLKLVTKTYYVFVNWYKVHTVSSRYELIHHRFIQFLMGTLHPMGFTESTHAFFSWAKSTKFSYSQKFFLRSRWCHTACANSLSWSSSGTGTKEPRQAKAKVTFASATKETETVLVMNDGSVVVEEAPMKAGNQ